MQRLLHVARPPPQAHTPRMQLAPAPHTLLQVPQLEGSVATSVQPPSQSVWPTAHMRVQTPSEQTCPAAHGVPHAPQLAGSLCVLVQTLLQSMPSLKQLQTPPWQVV